jgi:hypothetical protein
LDGVGTVDPSVSRLRLKIVSSTGLQKELDDGRIAASRLRPISADSQTTHQELMRRLMMENSGEDVKGERSHASYPP